MTYNLKKDHVKNWELPYVDEKSMTTIDNDDEQDIYISERSSVASSNDITQTPSIIIKRLPTPTPSPPLLLPQKQPHSVRFNHNEIPVVTQLHLQRKEDKTKKTNVRKVPSNQGTLNSFAEMKPSDLGDNHYPHWYYHNVKTSEWIIRHRQTNDSQVIPHELLDSSPSTQQPALTTSSIKPRQQQPRKSRPNGVTIVQSNHDKHRHDRMEKNVSPSSIMISHDNHDNNHHQQHQRSTSKQHGTSKDIINDEHPTKQIISQQRRKIKTEHESTDHHTQITSNKPLQESNSLIITSTSLTNRPKNRSKNPLTSDVDENSKHRHHHHHSPSISSQPSHHHHHHQHFHVRRRPPSGAYLTSDIQVVDVSFKKPERSSYFQQVRDPFHTPVPPIHNQTSHLPPIIRDHHHKTTTNRFPTEYYGTLARQSQNKDWEETIEIPKIYKPDLQTRFYDRYLNNVTEKRLVA